MNWLDLVLIAVIVLPALRGLKAGFLAGAAGVFGIIGGIWAAAQFHGQLAAYLSTRWNWDEKIFNFLISRLNRVNPGEFNREAGMPGKIMETLLPSGGTVDLNTQVSVIAQGILNIAAFLLLVVFIYVVAGTMLKLLSGAVSHTPLYPLDKLGGLVLGLLKGAFFAAVLLMLFLSLRLPTELLSGGEGPGMISLAAEKSKIAPFLLRLIGFLDIPLPNWGTNIMNSL